MPDTPQRAADVPIRPAATVMLVRDGEAGLEVFMMQRTLSAAFAHGMYVFPGGKVDAADEADHFEPICDGLDDGPASERLGLDSGGLAWYVAAVREVFEEAGVLLARREGDDEVVDLDEPDIAARYNDARHAIHEGRLDFAQFCADEELLLLVDSLHLVDHWITPQGERRRFDTRFFLGAAPPAQHPLHDDKETIDSRWVRPADAIDLWRSGELQMLPPTIATLEFLLPHATAGDAVAAAAAVGIPEPVLPKVIVVDGKVVGIKRPGDDGYDDAVEPEFTL
ncbi:NUDIX domain-containing protein [Ilumatobacter fluminis]|uniref:NUDIX domain-containing protein n=1 Tax=Ilumatobacter fluminis TaxID=467091 RepID=A0A4R7HW01_9ACTN|nr:NUDIX domain-containing protein [Ilumatobacter fluminis]TDT15065.1 NUDIX domain-containing protein [Ilumatobacter fluminis]